MATRNETAIFVELKRMSIHRTCGSGTVDVVEIIFSHRVLFLFIIVVVGALPCQNRLKRLRAYAIGYKYATQQRTTMHRHQKPQSKSPTAEKRDELNGRKRAYILHGFK